MKSIAVALILAFFVAAEGSSCPSNWLNLGDLGCFFFAEGAAKMNWQNAQSYCNSLNRNAHLAEITNAETNSFLTIGAATYSTKQWWIGGSDFLQVRIKLAH